MTLWSRDLAISRDKLKPLYLHYPIAYGHRTWLDGNLSWMAPNLKITKHSVHVVLQCHVTDKNHYISSTTVPMATKLDRMVTYFERLLTIKSFYVLITWSCKVTWQKNILYIFYKSAYGKQTWQNLDFVWWAPTYNNTWTFDHAALWDTRFTYMRRFST